jgi:hypothetical protein
MDFKPYTDSEFYDHASSWKSVRYSSVDFEPNDEESAFRFLHEGMVIIMNIDKKEENITELDCDSDNFSNFNLNSSEYFNNYKDK